ncbi:MAG TPA: hypothetical protein VFZ32_11620 [Micromonosporaceae bacterium]
MSSPFCAYLRVYEPLVAFDRERQRRWRTYAAEGRAVGTQEGPALQRQLVTNALGVGWTRLPELPDEAYLLEDSGSLLACPWELRQQVARAALSARNGVPKPIADAFVPSALVTAAEEIRDQWQDPERPLETRGPRLHESSSGWTVPLRWFVLVDNSEKDLGLGPGKRWLRYRTAMARARRRAHRALAVLRRALGDTPITMAVEEGARWLEEFHPRSIVEVDYGGLVSLFSERQLRDDDSPALAAEGLAALAKGDADAASKAYEVLVERWRAVQLLERCN